MFSNISLYSIVVVCLILILYFGLRYSYLNTKSVRTGGEDYYVHRQHHDPKKAADILKEVVDRNKILIEHLKLKYEKSNASALNPEKEGRIDIIPAGSEEDDVLASNIPYLMSDMNYLAARVAQLQERYQVDKISEISPLNPSGSTSYTENKGEKLVLCLRSKTPNAQGEHEFHDINLIMFVELHELTHVMNDRWGHTQIFWKLFKFLLKEAVECGVYNPINYRDNPQVYCGMNITYNPYFDPQMD